MLLFFLRTLRAHRWLRRLTYGLILSSLGSGLTFAIVIDQLLRLHATPATLALSFSLSVVPGILGSKFAERWLPKSGAFGMLIVGEAIGLAGLLIPYLGIHRDSATLLQFAQVASSCAAGVAVPATSLITKCGLSEEELPACSALNTLAFASNVLVGVGMGALLIGKVSPDTLLAFDACSYTIAIASLFLSRRVYSKTFPDVLVKRNSTSWSRMTSQQKRTLLLFPSLTFVTAPAVALLPAIAPGMQSIHTQSDVLTLLLARSIGQLCGPFVISPMKVRRAANMDAGPLLCLAAFLVCYLTLPAIHFFWLAFTFVVIAHVMSNIVAALARYLLLSCFSESEIASISGLTYRIHALTTGVLAMLAGVLADWVGPWRATLTFSGAGLIWMAYLSTAGRLASIRARHGHSGGS